jgi:NADH dehydrogenase
VRAQGLAESLGVELDAMGRIVVEQDCSIPGHPGLFAIGDIARFVPAGGDQPLPGLAAVAMQQGRYVAKAIVRRIENRTVQPFRYRDKGIMATIGRSRAVAQVKSLRLSGFIAWLIWLAVHIWYLIGFRNRLMVLINWFWNYVTYKRGARLITGARVPETPELKISAPASVPSSERQSLETRL